MRRVMVCFAAAILALSFFALPVCAEQTVDIGDEEWESFEEAIPDDIRDKLPSGTLDSSEDFSQKVSEMSTGAYIMNVIFDVLGTHTGSAVKLLLVICSLLLLSAVFNTMGEGMGNSSLSAAMRFCSVGALISVTVYVQYSHFEVVESFFEKIGGMMNGMVPLTASIWAMGGNVSTAGVGSASLYVMLAVSRELWAKTVIPVCCILTVLGFCDSLSDEVKTGRIMSAVKKIYNFLLGFVMTILLSSLTAQTVLSSAADTAAARAARLVSGAVIPVVGGSVGETFRTLASGVSYLKSMFGIGGIIMIVILLLPVLISTLLARFVFILSAGIADMLGCQGEARFLENMGEVYGIMVAVVSGVAVMFILSLWIFVQTVVAVM